MFAFGLCERLGFAHPDYLLQILSSRQLSEWAAYYSIQAKGYKPEMSSDEIKGVLDKVIANGNHRKS